MTDPSYTTSFVVDQTPQAAFDAINDVAAWWTGEIEGTTDELGAEFTYRYQDIHYSKMRITELVPAQRVAWLVVESRLVPREDPEEWTGTSVSFDLIEEDGRTHLRSPASPRRSSSRCSTRTPGRGQHG